METLHWLWDRSSLFTNTEQTVWGSVNNWFQSWKCLTPQLMQAIVFLCCLMYFLNRQEKIIYIFRDCAYFQSYTLISLRECKILFGKYFQPDGTTFIQQQNQKTCTSWLTYISKLKCNRNPKSWGAGLLNWLSHIKRSFSWPGLCNWNCNKILQDWHRHADCFKLTYWNQISCNLSVLIC